ncbi:MAG: sulfite exporter TauE/SafE family protein [Burkholderiaceae bacterium]|nr:sulfite exporter TauE/SafE family protein [Burkholderiaceae bacterium]
MTLFGIEPGLILELALLGIGTGFLAGLLGIGGGMVMVPFLTRILAQRDVSSDLAVKMAIATAMATILFTSLSTMRAHQRRGAIRWDIVRGMAPGIVLGGLVAGAGVFGWVKGQALALFFAAFVGYTATQMLYASSPKASRQLPGRGGQAAAGGGIGFLSGLVGAGGAFIAVPFMTRCNLPIHNAVATGAALGFPVALANTAGYVIGGWSQPAPLPGALGFLYLPALTVIALASVLVAPLGARAAHALDVRQLRRIFAVMLYALAADMLWRSLN